MPGIPCTSKEMHVGEFRSSRDPYTTLTEIMICGMLPSSAITFSLSMVSTLPTTSSRMAGRYFSTLSITRVVQLLSEEHGPCWTDQGISYDSTSIFLVEIWFSRAAPDIVAVSTCPGVSIADQHESLSVSKVILSKYSARK